MKVINLDKFKTMQQVSLDGKVYNIQGRSVESYINGDLQARMEAAKDEKERIQIVIAEIVKMSDLPKEVLMKQPFQVLQAIIQVSQGVDVDADPEEVEAAEKK